MKQQPLPSIKLRYLHKYIEVISSGFSNTIFMTSDVRQSYFHKLQSYD